ncbi:MAG: DNA polymerase III subunit gamma/tau, partial [Planctomycetes bacterium]|nr:DNA polymerase III subunit gamma/tau [Planctomycetota bacterium]
TRGVGKTTMARILAKALNCLSFDQPTAEPCNKCESCLAVSRGEDIDVIEIDAASNTGVEHMRDLRQNAIYRPGRARFKIYIIDEVHMLSTSAFNALLKTLEEPPEHVKFILATTEPNKILATILSRCQRFDFRNISAGDIAGQLKHVLSSEGIEADEAVIRRVARLANGSMRDALSLLDQLLSVAAGRVEVEHLNHLVGRSHSERVIDLAEAIGQGDISESLLKLDHVLSEGMWLEQFTQCLQDHFRDLLILRNCGHESDLVDLDEPSTKEKMIEQAKLFDDSTLVYFITVMEELRRSIKSGGSGRALVEAAVVRLTSSERFSDTKTLLEQLRELQAGVEPSSGKQAEPERLESKAPHQAPIRKASQANPNASSEAKSESTGLQIPETLNLVFFQNQWESIVAGIGQMGAEHLETCFKLSKPGEWDGQTLVIGYGPEQNGTYQFLSKDPSKLEEAEKILSELLSKPLQCQVRLTDRLSEEKAVEPSHRAPGAKPNQKEIQAAMQDQRVLKVQEILGGSVKQVQRLDQ